ncbi:four-helix bundle copper-binding protein [Hymenobacter artigasi]|uniref:Four-helix bundle copper-binding protein n=1 Tax=Hymenobacter artigasi TaxID=2719616 RepID=A0ABX1HI71_9BACT|nr:four-helix bundle copper-binding protein [Hymenobacter artigasi]NKI88671.1 hypothetical protein [Hymenobacter artigasi]
MFSPSYSTAPVNSEMLPRQQVLLDALFTCATACNEFIAYSWNEPDLPSRARSMRLGRDCADLCQLAGVFVARGSEHFRYILRECAELCRACADETTQHPGDLSRRCTEACRMAEDACRTSY